MNGTFPVWDQRVWSVVAFSRTLSRVRSAAWLRGTTTKMDQTLLIGDCARRLRELRDETVDLVFTSPPYAEQRKATYGGVKAEDYIAWFLPIAP